MKDSRLRIAAHLFSRLVRHGGIVDVDGVIPRCEGIALLRFHRVAHHELLRAPSGDNLRLAYEKGRPGAVLYGHVVRAHRRLVDLTVR